MRAARAAGDADAAARVVAFEQCRSMSVALRKGGARSGGARGTAVLVGATAWGFASEGAPDAVFDYLFVDEAGQVRAANIVAGARALDARVAADGRPDAARRADRGLAPSRFGP